MMPVAWGIAPVLGENEPVSFEERSIDANTFENDPGIDGGQVAIDEIGGHISTCHLYSTTSLPEARKKPGGSDALFNKIGIISKIRAGTMKPRTIHDTKRSRCKAYTAKCRRMFLPRLLDAVPQFPTLMALSMRCPDVDTELFVTNSTEAFRQIPLHPSERKFFAENAIARWSETFPDIPTHGPRKSVHTFVLGEIGRTIDAAHAVLL